eukprot:3905789-Pleurochrysis_carterae.AAC.1
MQSKAARSRGFGQERRRPATGPAGAADAAPDGRPLAGTRAQPAPYALPRPCDRARRGPRRDGARLHAARTGARAARHCESVASLSMSRNEAAPTQAWRDAAGKGGRPRAFAAFQRSLSPAC